MIKNLEKKSEGIKIFVYLVRPISDEGHKKLGNLKSIVKKIYMPLKPILLIPAYYTTKKEVAELVYLNFGCTEGDVTTYCIRYWMKKGKWSRRLKRFCMLELWDKSSGEFGYKFIDIGMLGRFGFEGK